VAFGVNLDPRARLPLTPDAAYRGPNSFQATHAIEGSTEANMAGHSQFKNIMHKKGKQDAIRSKLFSKLAREITVAAKMGCLTRR
jgi:hypothetical protein